jgi:hypothetical protein
MYNLALFPRILASCHIQVSLPSPIGLSTAQCQLFKDLIRLLLAARVMDAINNARVMDAINNARFRLHFVAYHHKDHPQI